MSRPIINSSNLAFQSNAASNLLEGNTRKQSNQPEARLWKPSASLERMLDYTTELSVWTARRRWLESAVILFMYISLCMYVTYIYTYIHTHIHTHIHTYTHTYITLHYITLRYITLHYATYIHTYIHTYIYVCIHICIYSENLMSAFHFHAEIYTWT